MHDIVNQKSKKATIGYLLTALSFLIFIVLSIYDYTFQSSFCVTGIIVGIVLTMGNDYIIYDKTKKCLTLKIQKKIYFYKKFNDLEFENGKLTVYTEEENVSLDVSQFKEKEVKDLVTNIKERM